MGLVRVELERLAVGVIGTVGVPALLLRLADGAVEPGAGHGRSRAAGHVTERVAVALDRRLQVPRGEADAAQVLEHPRLVREQRARASGILERLLDVLQGETRPRPGQEPLALVAAIGR